MHLFKLNPSFQWGGGTAAPIPSSLAMCLFSLESKQACAEWKNATNKSDDIYFSYLVLILIVSLQTKLFFWALLTFKLDSFYPSTTDVLGPKQHLLWEISLSECLHGKATRENKVKNK